MSGIITGKRCKRQRAQRRRRKLLCLMRALFIGFFDFIILGLAECRNWVSQIIRQIFRLRSPPQDE